MYACRVTVRGKVLTFRSRCEKARYLLEKTSLTNSEVARKCKLTPAAVSIMNRKYGIREVRQYHKILS